MNNIKIIKAVHDYITTGKIGRFVTVENIGNQIVMIYKTKSAGSWHVWYNRLSRYLSYQTRDVNGKVMLEGKISHLEIKNK